MERERENDEVAAMAVTSSGVDGAHRKGGRLVVRGRDGRAGVRVCRGRGRSGHQAGTLQLATRQTTTTTTKNSPRTPHFSSKRLRETSEDPCMRER